MKNKRKAKEISVVCEVENNIQPKINCLQIYKSLKIYFYI